MSKILYIPDCQVKEGVDLSFLDWIGKYIVAKKPDIIVQGGDFSDMPSLSSYDIGKKDFEGRRYHKDIEVTHEAMRKLLNPLREFNEKARATKAKQYKPKLVLTLGNHEERINRVTNSDPKLDGTISIEDLGYKEFGWDVYPFLYPVVIDGVCFSHYFPTGVAGRAATTSSALVSKMHMSCVAGHQQGKQVAYGKRPDGTTVTCIIAGSCYLHDEKYMGHQGNDHWRGIIMLHEVHDGCFDEMFISLNYLQRKYG